jgi:acyl carrier protein
MQKDEFKVKLADILEIDEVHDSDVLRDYPEWDSLTVLSVISMIHGDYGVSLSATQIRDVVTVQSLYDLIGR